MFYYLHYVLMTSGLSGISVLLAVYFRHYTDASQTEIGALLMTFPFVCLFIKPLFCSMADRHQAHKVYLLAALVVELLGYAVFLAVPFFPAFYVQHPRAAWYLLCVACHVGNGGLGVAWSLGDCLAMNMSQKSGVPFGRMRLMGTVSWGVYGFIIGQINEIPALPKYVPSFIILVLSLAIEIVLVICWNNEDFEMVDPLAKLQAAAAAATTTTNNNNNNNSEKVPPPPPSPGQRRPSTSNSLDEKTLEALVDSTPSSLSGTLRLSAKLPTGLPIDDLSRRLARALEDGTKLQADGKKVSPCASRNSMAPPADHQVAAPRGFQMALMSMMLAQDGRILKYTLLFTVFGFFMAPMNFIFLSVEQVCREKDYNFSQLAGAILISQASIETFFFLIVPWMMRFMSRSCALTLGLLLMGARFLFFSGWYYTSDISPYWAIIAEWGHGISYGIFATIQADVALLFANESRLFIGDLRRKGLISEPTDSNGDKIEAEENSIKMALRATMQAIFGGFQDGGQGLGSLLCGLFTESYSYAAVWQLFMIIAAASVALHQVTEWTNTKFSDTYKPPKGTKAYEIMRLSEEADKLSRQKKSKGKGKSAAAAASGGASPLELEVNAHEPARGC